MSTSKAAQARKAAAALQAASEAEAARFRGTFALIPATATEAVCMGAGHGEGTAPLPLKSFPTTTRHGGLEATQRRTSECRACRNSRQGRAEKAAAKAEAEAKAKAAQARQERAQARQARQGTKPARKGGKAVAAA